MWFESGRLEQVAELIEAGCPDLDHADFSTPALVKEACYNLFVSKYPNHIAVKSQQELDSLVKDEMTETVYVKPTMHAILQSAPKYKATVHVMTKVTPLEVLESWLRKNRTHMRKEAIVNFKELTNKAHAWKS